MKKLGGARPAKAVEDLPCILYVEDNDENFDVVQLRLGRAYALVRAASDREACARLKQSDKHYAVLMDIELAGSRLNGIQLTRLIRGTLPVSERPTYAMDVPVSHVPILIVSAYGSNYRSAELLAAGADDVLAKPVDFTRLSLALTAFHLKRLGTRKAP
jgi:CheY-like chemotaxis protein